MQEEKPFSPTAREHKIVRRLNMTAVCTSQSMSQAANRAPAPGNSSK